MFSERVQTERGNLINIFYGVAKLAHHGANMKQWTTAAIP